MSIRRTRQEKKLAAVRRNWELKPQFHQEQITIEVKKDYVKPNFYQPEISLPMGVIKMDLVKTAVVTVIALFLQAALYAYLQRGGWNAVLSTMHKISI